jgi:hypothetical protein
MKNIHSCMNSHQPTVIIIGRVCFEYKNIQSKFSCSPRGSTSLFHTSGVKISQFSWCWCVYSLAHREDVFLLICPTPIFRRIACRMTKSDRAEIENKSLQMKTMRGKFRWRVIEFLFSGGSSLEANEKN